MCAGPAALVSGRKRARGTLALTTMTTRGLAEARAGPHPTVRFVRRRALGRMARPIIHIVGLRDGLMRIHSHLTGCLQVRKSASGNRERLEKKPAAGRDSGHRFKATAHTGCPGWLLGTGHARVRRNLRPMAESRQGGSCDRRMAGLDAAMACCATRRHRRASASHRYRLSRSIARAEAAFVRRAAPRFEASMAGIDPMTRPLHRVAVKVARVHGFDSRPRGRGTRAGGLASAVSSGNELPQ